METSQSAVKSKAVFSSVILNITCVHIRVVASNVQCNVQGWLEQNKLTSSIVIVLVLMTMTSTSGNTSVSANTTASSNTSASANAIISAIASAYVCALTSCSTTASLSTSTSTIYTARQLVLE